MALFQQITGASTTVLLPAKPRQPAELVWFLLTNDPTATATFQFQDTAGNPISATHAIANPGGISLAEFGSVKFRSPSGLGIQIVNSAGNMAISYGGFYP